MNMKISLIELLSLALLICLSSSQCTGPDAVGPLPNITNSSFCSYAGFAPLDNNNDSALFYWYVPNQAGIPNAPVIVWLQGEIGLSSTWGLLTERIGPFVITPNGDGGETLQYMDDGPEKSWSYSYNILFIDNPVGIGFSYFTPNKTTEVTSIEENADNIWTAIQYFMTIHAETENLQWYFAGEAMGSKTVTTLAYQTVENNKEISLGNLKGIEILLGGIIVGNGVFNGLTQTMSLITTVDGASFVAPYQMNQLITLSIHCENNAFNAKLNYGIDSCNNMGAYIKNVSGVDPSAILLTTNQTSALLQANINYLKSESVYTALNVANSPKNGSSFQNLNMKAAKAIEQETLNDNMTYINFALSHMPCLIFDGAFDLEHGPSGTSTWLTQLNNPYPNILNQTRNIWFNSSQLPTGYYRSLENLTYITFDFAGAYVPYFQLNDSVLMLNNFIQGIPFDAPNSFENVSVVHVMGGLMNNCSGNGKLSANGVCVCDMGYQLGDCSILPQALGSDVNVTLGPRGMAFYILNLDGSDNIVQIIGNAFDVIAFYSYSGTITDESQAVAVLFPTIQTLSIRSLYISAAPGSIVYLTIQNSNFFDSSSLLILASKVLIVESFFASTFSAVVMILITLASSFSLYTAVAFIIRQRKRKVENPMITEIASQSSNMISQVQG